MSGGSIRIANMIILLIRSLHSSMGYKSKITNVECFYDTRFQSISYYHDFKIKVHGLSRRLRCFTGTQRNKSMLRYRSLYTNASFSFTLMLLQVVLSNKLRRAGLQISAHLHLLDIVRQRGRDLPNSQSLLDTRNATLNLLCALESAEYALRLQMTLEQNSQRDEIAPMDYEVFRAKIAELTIESTAESTNESEVNTASYAILRAIKESTANLLVYLTSNVLTTRYNFFFIITLFSEHAQWRWALP